MKFPQLILTLLACFCAFAATAQDIECDRPDQGETPVVVPAGHFQMENGFSYEHESATSQNFVHPSSLLKYGLGNVAEFRFEIESSTERTIEDGKVKYTPGIKPLAFGAKLAICEEEKARPKVSVIVISSIPILATKEFQENYPAPEVRFLFQHSLGESVKLAYNLGGRCNADDFLPEELYTLTGSFKLSKKFESFVEVYGFLPYHFSEQNQHVDGGFMFYPVPNVMLDINAGIDIHNHPGWFTGFGVSFLLPKVTG